MRGEHEYEAKYSTDMLKRPLAKGLTRPIDKDKQLEIGKTERPTAWSGDILRIKGKILSSYTLD
jgi:hypothetical protein